MKKSVKVLLAAVLALSMLIGGIVYVSAATAGEKDGLYLSVETDADIYQIGDTVSFTVTVKNGNEFEMKDISVSAELPEGFTTKSNESKWTFDLAPGEQNKISSALTAKGGAGWLLYVGIVLGVLAVIAFVTVLLLYIMRRQKKALYTAVCLLLCVGMMLPMLSAVSFAEEDTKAEESVKESSLTVDKTVTVDKKPIVLRFTASYTLSENDIGKVNPLHALLYGFDVNEYDSDGDGVSNYAELYQIGTNPTVVDSDGDGISDGDADADGDGLTNKEEMGTGTSPILADSDKDGLSDFEELNEFATHALNFDTDGDSLADGDEITLGLDPKNPKTDGKTADGKRVFTQELSDNNIEESLLSSDSDAIPSLILETAGSINRKTSITAAEDASFGDSRAVLGTPIAISGENLDKGTIRFTLKEEVSLFEGDSIGYPTNIICKLDEKGSNVYLETKHEDNVISADISGQGTYFVLDIQNLFDELGLSLPTLPSIRPLATGIPMSVKSASLHDSKALSPRIGVSVMAQADIVFIIDTTGSMGDEIGNVKDNVEKFVDMLKAKGVSAALALVDYQDITHDGMDSTTVHKNGSSNWFYDTELYKEAIDALELGHGGDYAETAVDALETARLIDMRASAGKIFVLITDAEYKVENRYDIPSMDAEITLLKNSGITCAVVTDSDCKAQYRHLYEDTGGIYANIYGDFQEELAELADKIGEDIVGKGYWIYLDGPVPVPVRLDAEPEAGSKADTDGDGIYDIDELESITPDRFLDLDALLTAVSGGVITGTDYGTVAQYSYKSNPIVLDTDYDGINDDKDTQPRNNKFKGRLINSIPEGINVDFTMDYRRLLDNTNTSFNRIVATVGCIYATLAYGGSLNLTSGVTASGDIKNTYNTFGLRDVVSYDLKTIYSDDDVSEIIIGHRMVDYGGVKNAVLVVSMRGTNKTVEEWSSNFDVGADTDAYYSQMGLDPSDNDWENKENHKGFDVAANRCYRLIMSYIEEYITDRDAKKSIFITGHSRGAAIANLLGVKFEDDSAFHSLTYGFATPNTTTNVDAADYRTIFSVVNEDDIVPYLPLDAWHFTKYGSVERQSIEKDYENKWWGAQEGTWEWLLNANRKKDKLDYNFSGGKENTLRDFGSLVAANEDPDVIRASLYTFYEGDEYRFVPKITYNTREEAEKAARDILQNYTARMARNAEIEITQNKKEKYQLEINQSPAFLMMTIAGMAAGVTPADGLGDVLLGYPVGYTVASRYNGAKYSFALMAIDSVSEDGELARLGGMVHGHWTETYYLIARYAPDDVK